MERQTDEHKAKSTGCPLIMESHGIQKRPFSRPGKSWKIAKVMESRGKVMENDDNVI